MSRKLNNKLLCDPHKCHLCLVNNNIHQKVKKRFRSIIEIHHLIERNDGGTNTPENLIPICSNCHSKVHEGLIKLDKWYFSTRGWIFHYWDETGKECWS